MNLNISSWRKATIGQKLFGGFGFTLLVLALLSGYSILQFSAIDKALRGELLTQVTHEHRVFKIRSYAIESELALFKYFRTPEADLVKTSLEQIGKAIEEATVIQTLSTDAETLKSYDLIKLLGGNIQEETKKTQQLTEKIGLNEEMGLKGKMRASIHQLEAEVKRQNLESVLVAYLELRRIEKDFMLRQGDKYLTAHQEAAKTLDQLIQNSRLSSGDKGKLQTLLSSYREDFVSLTQAQGQLKEQMENVESATLTISGLATQLAESEANETLEISDSINRQINLSKVLLWTAALVGLVGSVLFVLWFVRNLTNLLLKLSADLDSSASQVAAASEEIARGSQQLSEGATEQAASLEQTSASMEEMNSQTEQNSEAAKETAAQMQAVKEMMIQSTQGARSASKLAAQAKEAAGQGAQAMSAINQAMDQIADSSRRITDIMEVINEITHQTKMLATNAAIEAARAGESGKGFSVVANEVSKLAESSKSAAKDVANLIKESAKRAEIGIAQVKQGEQVLKEILDRSTQVGKELESLSQSAQVQAEKIEKATQAVQLIATASIEQANGIHQVSQAVIQMDQVTQSNAANAEETASAAEQLSAQAKMMHDLVSDLAQEVGAKLQAQGRPKAPKPAVPKAPPVVKPKGNRLELRSEDLTREPVEPLAAPVRRKIKPSESIPLRDDFAEF